MVNSWLVVLFICFFTCQQGEGKSCSAELPCDRKAGLHCSPKPRGVCQACGVNNRKDPFVNRIVGGKPTHPKAWPWMAGVTKKTSMNFAFCGGTLITDRHVLTAAHCLSHFTPLELMVRLGEYDFDKVGDNSPMDFEIEKIDIHEKYDTETTDNDIAVLTLRTEVKFNEFIWPACLPSPSWKLPVNQIGLVAGWGTKYLHGPTNSVLHEAAVKVWRQSDCTEAYADRTITDNMMCCGWATGGIDSCHGDSGGPFMMQEIDTYKWVLVGIVSWGRGCASPNLPGVYAKVNNFLDWIESHTKPIAVTPVKTPPTDTVCKGGYELLKGAPGWCVKVNTNTINWAAASEACVAEGGALAIVDSPEKQEAISNMMKERNIADLWFGLSDTKEEGKYQWIDGTELSSQATSRWGPNQPDGGDQNEDCIHFSSSWEYKWNDVTCHALFPYLCEQKKQVTCPAGWVASATTCFHIGEGKLNYDGSVAYCTGQGGSLAVTANAEDMAFARGLLNQKSVKEVWIGLRRDANGGFKWTDGTPFQYQSWTNNQPDNYLEMENCVTMDKFYSYLWNDDGCHKPMQQLCSRRPS